MMKFYYAVLLTKLLKQNQYLLNTRKNFFHINVAIKAYVRNSNSSGGMILCVSSKTV